MANMEPDQHFGSERRLGFVRHGGEATTDLARRKPVATTLILNVRLFAPKVTSRDRDIQFALIAALAVLDRGGQVPLASTADGEQR